MNESLSTYLLTQGVLGVACLVLGIVVVYLQRKLDRKDARIDELQSQRLQDTRELSEETAKVVSDLSQNIRILTEKIEVGKGRR
jgi:cell division protein FtsL